MTGIVYFITLSPSLSVILREQSDRRISLRVNSAKGLDSSPSAQNDKMETTALFFISEHETVLRLHND